MITVSRYFFGFSVPSLSQKLGDFTRYFIKKILRYLSVPPTSCDQLFTKIVFSFNTNTKLTATTKHPVSADSQFFYSF